METQFRGGTSVSSEWEEVTVVSSRHSVGSLSSHDSDKVIIFEGRPECYSEPGSKTSCALFEPAMSIEQRLLDQIAELAEDLDESQEQSKLLLLQNDRLMSENDELKRKVARLLQLNNNSGDNKQTSSEIFRISLSVAGGMVIISLVRKRLLANSVGLLSAAVLGGCVTLYDFLQMGDEESRPEP